MNASKAYLVNNAGGGGVGGVPLSMDGSTAGEGRTTLVEFQLDANVSPPSPNSRLWAWRWTLSPVYPATFPLTAPT